MGGSADGSIASDDLGPHVAKSPLDNVDREMASPYYEISGALLGPSDECS